MQDDMQVRQDTMQRDVLLVATVGTSLLNGMHFSPIFDPILFLLKPFVAAVISSPILLFYFTSLFISVVTLLIAGVGPALYERIRGHKESTPISIGLWFLATVIASTPGLLGAFGLVE